MKKIFIVALVFMLYQSAFAQTDEQKAIQEFNLWSECSNSIATIFNLFYNANEDGLDEGEARKALELVNTSIAHCEKAKEIYPACSTDADVLISRSCIQACWFYTLETPDLRSIFTLDTCLYYIKKSLSIRPTLEAIPYGSFKIATTSADFFENNYWDQIYLAYALFCNNKEYETCKKYAVEYIDHIKKLYPGKTAMLLAMDTAKSYEYTRVRNITTLSDKFITGDQLVEFKVLLVEIIAADYYLDNKDKIIKDLVPKSDLAVVQKSEKLLTLTDDGSSAQTDDWLTRLYYANMQLGRESEAMNYLTEAKLHDHSNLDEMWDYLEKTIAWNDQYLTNREKELKKSNIKRAVEITESKLEPDGTSAEYEKLLPYYEYLNDESATNTFKAKVAEIKAREEKAARREKIATNWNLSVGIAPGKLIWNAKYNQFSAHAFVTLAGFSFGGRYCKYDMYTDKHRFGVRKSEEGELGSTVTYSGWEASVWKNFGEGFSFTKLAYLRPYIELRYGQYDFLKVTSNVVETTTNTYYLTGQTLNPVGNRFDVSYNLEATKVFLHRLYISGVAGIGLGYRWLDSGYDNSRYYIEDVRYNNERWPKITCPLRVGLRVGIILF